ncbi:MAG: uroporphyrinogen decarboxylase family protein [Bacillota bacterium]
MNSREIIDNLIRGKKADRVGLYDNPWPETVEKWEKEGHIKEGVTKEFGFDKLNVGGWFQNLPLLGGELIEETDEWRVTENGAGASFKYWKNKSGTPEHIGFKMSSREIWDRDYRHHLLEVDRNRIDFDWTNSSLKYARDNDLWAFYGHMFIWETMRSSLGDVCMYETLILDPDWIHDYNRVYTDFYKNHFKLIIEECGKPDGIWLYEDLGYNQGLFCSPNTLRELFLPYFKEIVDFFHDEYDLPVVLHSCGNITAALPMIVEAGFDALNPMEAKAGCDIFAFAEQYGDKLAFVGGLDARILESGDRDLIKTEVIKIVEGMKERGARYIFGSDHSLSPLVKYEDFVYAIEVYKEHMMY